MEIRKITQEECAASNRICAVAFYEREHNPSPPHLYVPSSHYAGFDDVWAAFDDHGKMFSRTKIIPYTVMFDGHECEMGGVAGVATLPEFRKSGAVREIMRAALHEMREKGQIFSYLYPFSHTFYRRFGYEISYNKPSVEIPLPAFGKYPRVGSLTFFQKDDDLAPYSKIHRKFVSDKNLAIVKNDKRMSEFLNHDPVDANQFTYLWCNDAGEAKSYLVFSPVQGGQKGVYVKDLAWVDSEGLFGIFGWLPVFFPRYSKLVWTVPDGIAYRSLVDEPHEIKMTSRCGGMNRIVDVLKVLSLLEPPEGEGNVTVSVEDKLLDANTGIYQIEWSGGELHAKKVGGHCDMRVGVETLAQLAVGYMTPTEAADIRRVEIISKVKLLNTLFHKKCLYTTEEF
ncbi:MAG: GNAT family N-acetyltransferase [Phycisphaerales bacterium]|nr:GNAT family N-acetyltransferase [Phycisphaerales bacterium]